MEKLSQITNIENFSGTSTKKIHGKITPLKKRNYRILDLSIGGDAPKDFIQAYIYGDSKKDKSKKWSYYIAKVGQKWYPIESINEYLLNRIGEVLGLNMAKSHLRLTNGQLRFLSKYFTKRDEELVHGANIYSAYLSEQSNNFVQEAEDENLSREWFTFQFTVQAIKSVFPVEHKSILACFVRMLIFDAISGNNDRHFYNWGVLRDIRGKRKPVFSPIYDSARGLFWNYSEKKVEKLFTKDGIIDEVQFNKYILNSLPKTGWEGKKKINHFDLIKNIHQKYPEFQNDCISFSNNVALQKVLKMLNTEFCNLYSKKRLILIEECLKRRFDTLQIICS